MDATVFASWRVAASWRATAVLMLLAVGYPGCLKASDIEGAGSAGIEPTVVFNVKFKPSSNESRQRQRRWRDFARSWKQPGIVQRAYSLQAALQVVKEVVPHLAATFLGFQADIERSDFARYAILYRDGGVYSDLDQELWDALRLQGLANSGLVVLPVEVYQSAGLLAQAIMISPPRHAFWLELMQYIARNYRRRCSPPENTGPVALTNFFERSGACQRCRGRLRLDGQRGLAEQDNGRAPPLHGRLAGQRL